MKSIMFVIVLTLTIYSSDVGLNIQEKASLQHFDYLIKLKEKNVVNDITTVNNLPFDKNILINKEALKEIHNKVNELEKYLQVPKAAITGDKPYKGYYSNNHVNKMRPDEFNLQTDPVVQELNSIKYRQNKLEEDIKYRQNKLEKDIKTVHNTLLELIKLLENKDIL